MTSVKFDTLRSISSGSIGGSYTAVGTPLQNNWRIIKITNTMNADAFISVDGSTACMAVPAGSFVLYDFGTNEPGGMGTNDNMVVAKGTQFYVSALGQTSGSVYIEGVYS